MKFHPAVDAAIEKYAAQHGVDPATVRAMVGIESGGRPGVRTGSYSGLLQLSPQEFQKHGGQGDIFDIDQNLSAGVRKLRAEADQFKAQYGRDPSAAELYMIHQQGVGGSAQHWANPDRPAWQNMLDTGEGRQKGAGWARAAIWGNVPDDLKRQFGSVDNITSKQFTEMWAQKVARFGAGGTTNVANAAPAQPPAWTGEGDTQEKPENLAAQRVVTAKAPMGPIVASKPATDENSGLFGSIAGLLKPSDQPRSVLSAVLGPQTETETSADGWNTATTAAPNQMQLMLQQLAGMGMPGQAKKDDEEARQAEASLIPGGIPRKQVAFAPPKPTALGITTRRA